MSRPFHKTRHNVENQRNRKGRMAAIPRKMYGLCPSQLSSMVYIMGRNTGKKYKLVLVMKKNT